MIGRLARLIDSYGIELVRAGLPGSENAWPPRRLRDWPASTIAGALLCDRGRQHLRHRFEAWAAQPGEVWHNLNRDVDGIIVQVPRPGEAIIRVTVNVPRGSVWVGPAFATSTIPGTYRIGHGRATWLERADLIDWDRVR